MLKWCVDFEIGIEEIDNEHRKIIEQFEKLYSLMREGQGHEYYGELLVFLNAYIDEHFAHEEALQEKVDYPNFQMHKRIHDDFKIKINQLMDAHDPNDVKNKDLIELNLFIKDWLTNHILIEDKKLGNFVTSKV